MAQTGQVQQRYRSDLTDEQWVILEPLLPPRNFSLRIAYVVMSAA